MAAAVIVIPQCTFDVGILFTQNDLSGLWKRIFPPIDVL